MGGVRRASRSKRPARLKVGCMEFGRLVAAMIKTVWFRRFDPHLHWFGGGSMRDSNKVRLECEGVEFGESLAGQMISISSIKTMEVSVLW